MSDATALVCYPWLADEAQQLLGQAREGRMHHALMLHGPVGIGKEALARWLLAARLCLAPAPQGPCLACRSCQLFLAQTHPDYVEILPEKDGGQIAIDAVREAIDFIHKTPSISGHKAVLLCPAEALNAASANALLKVLEEPTGNSSLILVGQAIHRLPATVLSRCRMIAFGIPPRDAVKPWLIREGRASDADIDLWLDACGGAPLKVLADGETAVKTGDTVVRDLEALAARKTDPMAVAAHWQKMDVSLCLQAMWRYLLARQQDSLQAGEPAVSLAECLQDVVATLRVLDKPHTHPNAQLLLEQLLIACGSRLALK